MRLITTLALGLVVAASAAQAQDKADKASQKFLTEAIQGNYAEVEMGKLAQSNGESQAVKSYGQTLATDHGAALDKSVNAAKSLNVQPPTGPSAKQKSEHDKMAKMKGAAFDKKFAQMMVADHKKDISAYTKAGKKNDAAGQYAKDALPTLQQHLQTAQGLQKQR